MKKRSLYIITGQILLAFTILLSTLLITNTLKQIKLGRGRIDVKGCAEQEIVSDFVTLQNTINTTAETLQEAYQKIENDQAILHKYLEEQGIPKDGIATSAIRTSINFEQNQNGFSTNKIENYQLHQDFLIYSNDIPLISKLSQNITSLIKEGLSITSYPACYFYLNINELKIAMLEAAAKDARDRAAALVSNSGSKVGNLISAHQGVFQITPAFSTTVSDYGENDTTSIVKRIKAVVTMEYEIY